MLGVYLNFLVFSFFASITPGPTNLISLSIGARQGPVSAVPFTFGASCSAALMLLLAGLGISSLVIDYPVVMVVMSLVGGVWISWMAWQLFFAEPLQAVDNSEQQIGWLQGAGLQLINPKTWMMATSATAIFSIPDANSTEHATYLALIILIVSFPCLMAWSWLGHLTRSANKMAKREIYINRVLAVMLFGITWSAIVLQLFRV